MTGEIFIRAASCISPQKTFRARSLPQEIISSAASRFGMIEPDYKIHLNIPAARRMSRLIKTGVCAALDCLKDADIKIADAIIAGTGLGSMEDSEKFLLSLIEGKEQTLSPTSFIFSTHNTVAGQIALLLQCNNYNFTHTHRGLSFENTLTDSMLFLADHPEANILAGAADEITNTSFKILSRLGVIKKDGRVEDAGSAGTIAGEGAAFFLLNKKESQDNLARIKVVGTISNCESETELFEFVKDFIQRNNIQDDDFILTGMNGDKDGDRIYHQLIEKYFTENNIGRYKHLCGEYHTSSAFAVWLATGILKDQIIPEYVSFQERNKVAPNRIVILNHYKAKEFSFIILERC